MTDKFLRVLGVFIFLLPFLLMIGFALSTVPLIHLATIAGALTFILGCMWVGQYIFDLGDK